MDEDDINGLIQGCKTLKYKFHGVFAANNFPEKMNRNSFLIVNAATAENIGSHWLLLCRKNNQLLFADPLGQPISSYKHLYQRIVSVGSNHNIYQLLENEQQQMLRRQMLPIFAIMCYIHSSLTVQCLLMD